MIAESLQDFWLEGTDIISLGPLAMLDSVAQATAHLHSHCIEDPSSMPLNDVLDGIWRLLVWAAGFPCPTGFQQLPVRQKGLHVGTAAVFMVAGCLLHCRVKKKVLACLGVCINFLLSWLFLPDKLFGRKPEGAVRALATAGNEWFSPLKDESQNATKPSDRTVALPCPPRCVLAEILC